jgi:hypothetical protein
MRGYGMSHSACVPRCCAPALVADGIEAKANAVRLRPIGVAQTLQLVIIGLAGWEGKMRSIEQRTPYVDTTVLPAIARLARSSALRCPRAMRLLRVGLAVAVIAIAALGWLDSAAAQSPQFPVASRAAPIAPPTATHDFNGDGRSDILWRNFGVWEVVEWQMNGTSVIGGGSAGSSLGTWSIVGQRDFNHDGRADLLWRDGFAPFEVVLWFLNGTSVIGGGLVGSASSDWGLAGTGDFNGDGFADILWFNNSTGQVVIWLMNGTSVIGGGLVGSVNPILWSIGGIGDFNGDGKSDILFIDLANQTVLWFLNGTTVIGGGAVVAPAPAFGWQMVGTGDFNGDGKSDILWYNGFTGVVVEWLMNGTSVNGGGSPGSVGFNSPWNIIETGDFNGDGRSDLLWYNLGTGQLVIWLLNGTSVIGGGFAGSADPLVWRPEVFHADD